jgi:hypothetical protein
MRVAEDIERIYKISCAALVSAEYKASVDDNALYNVQL